MFDFVRLKTESFPHLLPGVDPLSEHDGAVGAVPQGLERHVPVHGPHVVTAGHQQELALITPPSDHWTFHMAGRVWSTYLTVTTRGYITDPEPTYKGSPGPTDSTPCWPGQSLESPGWRSPWRYQARAVKTNGKNKRKYSIVIQHQTLINIITARKALYLQLSPPHICRQTPFVCCLALPSDR